MVEDVIEFNATILGIPQRTVGAMSTEENTHFVKCLYEEVHEYESAHTNGDFISQIDSLIDLIYFAYGGLYKMGLNANLIKMISDAVHDANMQKKRGIVHKRGDGTTPDAVKPEGWKSPEQRIMDILEEYV